MITKNFTLKLVKVNMFSLVMSRSIMLTKFIKNNNNNNNAYKVTRKRDGFFNGSLFNFGIFQKRLNPIRMCKTQVLYLSISTCISSYHTLKNRYNPILI